MVVVVAVVNQVQVLDTQIAGHTMASGMTSALLQGRKPAIRDKPTRRPREQVNNLANLQSLAEKQQRVTSRIELEEHSLLAR